jgi:glycosyltransferase involved in cell wall biosynthesis/uncharacterized coiled-coil protein SlyX
VATSADFSVVAIIAAYNEEDIIQHVVSDLINQGIQVYLLDDSSTDGTVAAVEPYVGRGVVAIERLAGATTDAAPGGRGRFDLERILRRKTELANELDAAWFINHDADEFRESPWSHLSLSDAIRHVDRLGFNAIDFAGLDFWPVDDGFRPGGDVRDTFRFYSELAPYDRLQVRCWKKTDSLELLSSGGHEARFADRKIFPVRFVLRHYPIRGQKHGERKVFRERRDRFLVHERAKGWHVQYDEMKEGASFIRDPSTLISYDPDALRLSLTLRHRGVEELEGALAEARSEVDSLRRELEQRTVSLAEARSEVDSLRRELEQRTVSLAEAREELDTRSAEITRVNQALAQRDADIERWRAAVDGLSRRLDAFHRSFSWRWTAPARAVYRVLRGR